MRRRFLIPQISSFGMLLGAFMNEQNFFVVNKFLILFILDEFRVTGTEKATPLLYEGCNARFLSFFNAEFMKR